MWLPLFVLLIPAVAFSQSWGVHSFDFGGQYTEGQDFRDDSVKSAHGSGFTGQVRFTTPVKAIRIGLQFDYTPMTVREYDPNIAASRTGWVYYQESWNQIRRYEALNNDGTPWGAGLDEDGNRVWEGGYDYMTGYWNRSFMISVEIVPITEGRIQPFVKVGAGPVWYNSRAWWYGEWGRHVGENKQWWFNYGSRAYADVRTRGWWWPGFIGAGLDFKLHDNVGFNISGQYYRTLKNHKSDTPSSGYSTLIISNNVVKSYYRLRASLDFYR
jgi:hypothetical protein